MRDIERILMECRYVISLNKNYHDLAKIFKVSVETIRNDLNYKLPRLDHKLYQRMQKVLKK